MEKSNLKPDEVYVQFHRDSEDNLWLIGTLGSLGLLRNNTIQPFTAIPEISDYRFNSIFEDREGNFWFGTNRNGLIIVSKSRVKNIGTQEGLSGNNILGLFEDSRGRYWVGTRGAGLNLITENGITNYTSDDGLASDIVHTIGEDKNGNIWVGHHENGLDKITDTDIENYQPGNNVEINNIRAIYSDKDKNFWLGTYDGLIKFDPITKKQTVYNEDDGLAGVKIRYITQAPDGAIWSGSLDGGVARFHDGEFTNYTTEQGLSSNNIRSIYIDEKDPETIWIGTENNGLNRLRNGEIQYINQEDGLPDHIIHWISQDENDWLWMSSNRGIFKIHKKELIAYLDNETEIFTLLHFGSEEGMRNPEANGSFQEAGLRTEDGRFWFATQEGVAIFSREVSTSDSVAPNVIIQGVNAAGNSYNTNEILIERGTKSFTVLFHALTYPSTQKTRFRYRLEGYENSWNEVAGTRNATYQNIPAGTYDFRVISASNDGIWSDNPAIATITVQPYIYEEPWFLLIMILLIAGGYYGATQIRYKYLLSKQKELEQVIQNQTAELRQEKKDLQKKNQIIKKQAAELEESNQTKDKFFSLIAHDLRNPFQGLVGLTELILMDVDDKKDSELKENVQHLYSSARSLHSFVEDLLNWASLQNGKMKPKPESININELVVQVLELFDDTAQQKDIELTFESKTQSSVHADRNMLKTILRNLISNAIKFTEPGGSVSVKVYKDGSFQFLEVQDNGIGMDKDMVEQLLQIDSNVSRSGTQNEKGSGLGLLICKEMIALQNGELQIKSKKQQGTTFIIKLPSKGLSLVQ
ncbi:two-component regulator propeller domain-containing protein [Gracilimonas sp.]|uniref:sensor histidine kinase n=1 Tax=Gracilimonas sp. TaxID=1974203 RepID=UPI0028719CED|nr:two-component regulator propeller domain-containing protein [Gracilimonas sp.]